MTKEEIEKVFDWLEENMNKECLFDLKMVDSNQITAYWKVDNKPFAQFYINSILKIIKED